MKNPKLLFTDFPQDTLFSALPPALQQVHRQSNLAGDNAMLKKHGEGWHYSDTKELDYITPYVAAYEQSAKQPYPHHIDFLSAQNQCEHWHPETRTANTQKTNEVLTMTSEAADIQQGNEPDEVTEYKAKLAKMTDEELFNETYIICLQAAQCCHKGDACWHWMGDACYLESQSREDKSIYHRAHTECKNNHS